MPCSIAFLSSSSLILRNVSRGSFRRNDSSASLMEGMLVCAGMLDCCHGVKAGRAGDGGSVGGGTGPLSASINC